MDYFKIFTIIFMIFIAYKLYLIENKSVEGFEGAVQSLGGVDDTNAINTLAQISKQLMAGGVTVPGNIAVQGDFSSFGPSKKNRVSFHTPADGRRALYIAPERMDGADWEWGNGLALDFKEKVFNTNSNSLIVGGNMTVKGGSISTGDAPGQSKGTIISNMGDSWGMLWGSECALIGQKGKPMRFGFADAYNAAGWDEKMRIQPDGSLIVQGRNILAELNECIKYNQQFKMSISDNRGGASGAASANMIGACNPECGGGARIVSTNEPGRQLGLQINRW